ncbi:hypothetical protein GCM10017322_06540 [Paracoccus aerius]|nr:hypothetical protein GCM10017322_06540 [Paracoccus aerius]
MDHAVQEGSGGQDDRPSGQNRPIGKLYAADPVVIPNKGGNFRKKQFKVWLGGNSFKGSRTI